MFVLVQEWIDLRCGPAVYAERFVVCADCRTLGPERSVLKEDARAWVLLPVEGYIGVAFTVHFFLSKVFRLLCHNCVLAYRPSPCFATTRYVRLS